MIPRRPSLRLGGSLAPLLLVTLFVAPARAQTDPPTPASAPAVAVAAPAEAAAGLCTDEQLHPDAAALGGLDLSGCNTNDGKRAVICLGPTGRTLVDPAAKRGGWQELEDKQLVELRLYTRSAYADQYNVAVRNERTVIWSPLRPLEAMLAAGTWARTTTVRTRVYGAGWLHVTINHTAHTEQLAAGSCGVAKGERLVSYHVAGRHHFGVGVLIAYVGLKDRSYGLATGDDGVSRIAEDQNDGVDYILNLVAYPLGVEEDKMLQLAPGIVLGTSLEKPGRRWYLGAQLELPLGFGLAGGTVVSVVPKLSEDLLEGQPHTGEIPTSDTATFSWWAGINLDLVLFTRFFRSLISPGAELPQVE